MPIALTSEQILALAPDPGVAKSGRGLASLKGWSGLGQSDIAAWGLCQGSGKEPYRVQVDLREPAFRCSCPSHKFPCKHGIGLLLLIAAQPAAAPAGPPPDWVAEWLARRDQTSQRKAQRSEAAEADPATAQRRAAAQEQRAQARETSVAAGLDELARWLDDLLRQGLATCPGRSPAMWDAMASRMVDAQAPGVARMLRAMGGLPASGEGWQARLLERMARLQLLIAGFARREQLPAELLADLRAQIGWAHDQEAVRAAGGLRDTWLVLGQTVEEEEQLTTQRTWLWGQSSDRPALLLGFAAPGQPLDASLAVGSALDAELAFFPSAAPLRALIVARHALARPAPQPYGHARIDDAIGAYAAALSASPWLDRYPLALQAATPLLDGERWHAQDADGRALPLAARGLQGWRLLALSQGRPIRLFGTWDGQALTPLSAGLGDQTLRVEVSL